jgi:hypothetical protein
MVETFLLVYRNISSIGKNRFMFVKLAMLSSQGIPLLPQ